MDLLTLDPDDDLERYGRELWLPYNRELAGILTDFDLADDVDPVESETEFRRERLADGSDELVVAEDGSDWVGFVVTSLDEPSPVFDRPSRVVVCDLYVDPAYRGTDLARELMAVAGERAEREGYPEVALDVDVPNERAVAFYEKLGFETARRRMRIGANELA